MIPTNLPEARSFPRRSRTLVTISLIATPRQPKTACSKDWSADNLEGKAVYGQRKTRSPFSANFARSHRRSHRRAKADQKLGSRTERI
jgi:hypothetical protein